MHIKKLDAGQCYRQSTVIPLECDVQPYNATFAMAEVETALAISFPQDVKRKQWTEKQTYHNKRLSLQKMLKRKVHQPMFLTIGDLGTTPPPNFKNKIKLNCISK